MTASTLMVAGLFAFVLIAAPVRAEVVLGSGSGSLWENLSSDDDLSDDRIGEEARAGSSLTLVSWTGGEKPEDLFDNSSGGSSKWFSGSLPVQATLEFASPIILTHFTLMSGNDQDGRHPDVFSISGSNNGTDFTTIYSYDNDGTAPWGGGNLEVRMWGSPDGPSAHFSSSVFDFATPAGYKFIRFETTSVVSGTSFQLQEIEYFGVPEPATVGLLVFGTALSMLRRRRR